MSKITLLMLAFRAFFLFSGLGYSAIEPYQCDDYWVDEDKSRHRKYSHRTREERKRFRKIIHIVAREMGADPRIFKIWAKREGNNNPYSIHAKEEDINANMDAWYKYRYDPVIEFSAEEKMRILSPQERDYWDEREKLRKTQLYKNNLFYDANFVVLHQKKDGSYDFEITSAWWRGYGSFGFNSVLYTYMWDDESAPWVFCSNEGIPAIITAVWAARKQARKCEERGYHVTYGLLDRKFSIGHCSEKYSSDFIRRAKPWKLNPDARPRLGRKWKRSETDREEILQHMLSKLKEEGIEIK